MDKKERQFGVITIEATLSLTAFLFLFMIIYSLISVCRLQAKMSIAISNTAKELSQYSYLYAVSGLKTAMDGVQEAALEKAGEYKEIASNINDVFEGISEFGGNLGENISNLDIDAISNKGNEISDKIMSTGELFDNELEKLSEDPKKYMFAIVGILASDGFELAKSKIVANYSARGLVKKHLLNRTYDGMDIKIEIDTYLRSMHVKDGWDGLNFSDSTLFPYGSDEIKIKVKYKVRILPLLPIDITLDFTQVAVTKGWLLGDTIKETNDILKEQLEKAENLWTAKNYKERVELMRNLGIKDLISQPDTYKVRSETYIHAYNPMENEVYYVSSSNPIYGDIQSIEEIRPGDIEEIIKDLVSIMEVSNQGRKTIKYSEKDSMGNISTKEIECSEPNMKVVLAIPEDKDLKVLYENAISKVTQNSRVTFDLVPCNGSVFASPSQPAGSE